MALEILDALEGLVLLGVKRRDLRSRIWCVRGVLGNVPALLEGLRDVFTIRVRYSSGVVYGALGVVRRTEEKIKTGP